MKMTCRPFTPRPQTRKTWLHLKLRPPLATAIAVGWGLVVSLVILNLATLP